MCYIAWKNSFQEFVWYFTKDMTKYYSFLNTSPPQGLKTKGKTVKIKIF